MLILTTSCITNCIMIDPISVIILGCLAGVCLVNIHSLFPKSNKNKKDVIKPKIIYTSEEEEIYLADNEDGPIWF